MKIRLSIIYSIVKIWRKIQKRRIKKILKTLGYNYVKEDPNPNGSQYSMYQKGSHSVWVGNAFLEVEHRATALPYTTYSKNDIVEFISDIQGQ